MQITKLEEYCKKMFQPYEIDDEILTIGEDSYKVITNTERILINEDGEFIEGEDYEEDINGYVYEFGGRWYIQEIGEEKVTLEEFKYIGNSTSQIPTKSFLGIRSGYELMNGMGLYPEWVKKAKFLGCENLGVCEKHSLEGVLLFQNECAKNKIKPITGMTIVVKCENTFELKLYAKDFQGWLNLLKFNEIINVDGSHYIDSETLIKHSKGLFIIADPKHTSLEDLSPAMKKCIDFYQLDTVRFLNEERDIEYINNLEKWILSHYEPISITDAFYLEKDDWKTREVMWAVAKSFDDKTNNQYFKNKSEYATELINMFESECKAWVTLFKNATANEELLVQQCNYTYDTNTRHLPAYIMTDEEKEKFSDNRELFIYLIQKGFKDRGIEDTSKYLKRLKVEIDVLKQGDVIDYFLSLYDIIKFAKSQGMLTGIGRGSAGGSLVAYLLGIIQIDPLEFNLLFERFLNLGRMGRWEDRPNYIFEDEDGNIIELAEGELARVKRNGEQLTVYCHEIMEGDEIIKT